MKKNIFLNKMFVFFLFLLCFNVPQYAKKQEEETLTRIQKLSDSEKNILNQFLKQNASLIVRIKATLQSSQKVENKLLNDDSITNLDKFKKQILIPAKSLFTVFYSFGTISNFLPKLLDSDNTKNPNTDFICCNFFQEIEPIIQSEKEKNQQYSNPNIPKEKKEKLEKEIITNSCYKFFDQKLDNKEKVLQLCDEFIRICGTITNNLSNEVAQKAEDLAKQLKNKKK
ncbi:hypothetical protein GF322_04240 [Candidatus Dependentiae bacterium]|nr:hypothetical protein [Candidatus Dependentiae bacterium]